MPSRRFVTSHPNIHPSCLLDIKPTDLYQPAADPLRSPDHPCSRTLTSFCPSDGTWLRKKEFRGFTSSQDTSVFPTAVSCNYGWAWRLSCSAAAEGRISTGGKNFFDFVGDGEAICGDLLPFGQLWLRFLPPSGSWMERVFVFSLSAIGNTHTLSPEREGERESKPLRRCSGCWVSVMWFPFGLASLLTSRPELRVQLEPGQQKKEKTSRNGLKWINTGSCWPAMPLWVEHW